MNLYNYRENTKAFIETQIDICSNIIGMERERKAFEISKIALYIDVTDEAVCDFNFMELLYRQGINDEEITLSDSQFSFLIENNLYKPIKTNIKYKELPSVKFNMIENIPELLNHYIKSMYDNLQTGDCFSPSYNLTKLMYDNGYLDSDENYPNGKSDKFYNSIINPTVKSIKDNDITLSWAICNNHQRIFDLIVDNKLYNLEQLDCSLNYVVLYGYLDMCKKLIDIGVKVTEESLISICEKGDDVTLKYIVDNKVDVDLNMKDDSLIKLSVKYGHIKVTEILLNNIVIDNYKKHEVSYLSVNYSHIEMVELLYKHDIFHLFNINEYIKIASGNGDLDIIKLLFLYNVTTDNLNIPLLKAVENEKLDVVIYFLKEFIIDEKEMDISLLSSVIKGDYETCEILIENGVDLVQNHDVVLQRALYFKNYDIIKLLINNGMDASYNNDEIIVSASRDGEYDLVELCIDKGGDVNAMYNNPIKQAKWNGYLDIVELLKKNGASLNN